MKITVRAELDFNLINYLCVDDFDGNKYIEGIGFKANNTLIVLENGDEFPIKPNTRSINLEDMLDSQGNKIFASLSEDGKGGDISNYQVNGHNWIAVYAENAFMWIFEKDIERFKEKKLTVSFLRLNPYEKMSIIGIKE